MTLRSLCFVFLFSVWVGPAAAADSTKTQSTEQVAQGVESTTQDSIAAKAWGLTDSEWRRYQEINSGPRGIWSPGLDPISVLGTHARSDAERRKYAEMQVHIDKARVDQELAFDREYTAAWKRLYPDLLPIGSGPGSQLSSTASPVQQGPDRLLVFVSLSCASCEESIGKLVSSGTAFDLFLVGTDNNDQAIRQWAQTAGIPPELVRSRKITLNHDRGQWLDLGGLTGTLPAAFQRAGEQWLPVDL